MNLKSEINGVKIGFMNTAKNRTSRTSELHSFNDGRQLMIQLTPMRDNMIKLFHS